MAAPGMKKTEALPLRPFRNRDFHLARSSPSPAVPCCETISLASIFNANTALPGAARPHRRAEYWPRQSRGTPPRPPNDLVPRGRLAAD